MAPLYLRISDLELMLADPTHKFKNPLLSHEVVVAPEAVAPPSAPLVPTLQTRLDRALPTPHNERMLAAVTKACLESHFALGSSVCTVGLKSKEWNMLCGHISGPLVNGRWPVTISTRGTKLFKEDNLAGSEESEWILFKEFKPSIPDSSCCPDFCLDAAQSWLSQIRSCREPSASELEDI